MKYRFITLLSLFVFALAAMAEGKAKYVFYFIGDGMGVNQVNAAETYLGALEGRIGIKELCFPSFPFTALVNTQSATNGVTDSAAGGVSAYNIDVVRFYIAAVDLRLCILISSNDYSVLILPKDQIIACCAVGQHIFLKGKVVMWVQTACFQVINSHK